MTGSGPRRRSLTVGAVVGIGILTLVPLTLSGRAVAAGSTADETSDDIRVTLTALGPEALGPNDTLEVRARVVNASDLTLQDVGARLRLDTAPFTSRAELADYASADTEVGSVVIPSLIDVAPELAPGQSATIRIQVPVSELALPDTFGVHALTLELRVAEPDGLRRTAGSVRTFVVDAPTPQNPTVRVSWLWPLVGTPARAPDGVLPKAAAESLDLELKPGGRLHSLLQAARGRPVTLLVDGALLEDVRSLATGRGLPADVQPSADAEDWLGGLSDQAGTPDGDVRALPYADPDLTAVVRARMGQDLANARSRGVDTTSTLLGHTVSRAPAWPGDGLINRATVHTLTRQDVTEVVLAGSTLEPQVELAGTPDAITTIHGHSGIAAVVADDTLSALLSAGPSSLGGVVPARQRLLAETAMIAAERPGDSRSVVATADRRWAPSSAWADTIGALTAPWLAPVTLRDLEQDPGDAPERTLAPYSSAATDSEVSPRQLSTVAGDQVRLGTFADATEDPDVLQERFEPALLAAQSTAWRGDGAAAGEAYTASVHRQVTATVTSVKLLPRGQVTLSSRTGIVPFAVQNTFDQEVRVRVRMTAIPSVRLTSDSTQVFTIPAGRTASVDVPAEATTDATFPVVATLLTPDGEPLGEPVRFTLRATGYGEVARVVVGGALVVLAVAVVVRVARRIRAAGRRDSGTLDL